MLDYGHQKSMIKSVCIITSHGCNCLGSNLFNIKLLTKDVDISKTITPFLNEIQKFIHSIRKRAKLQNPIVKEDISTPMWVENDRKNKKNLYKEDITIHPKGKIFNKTMKKWIVFHQTAQRLHQSSECFGRDEIS